jgi:hypothetical protein
MVNSQNLKASVSFVGDGTTNKFYFGFDYINKQFVKVQIGNEGQSLTYLSDYTVDDRSVVLKDTPAVGVAIRVYRETSSDRIVEWADGAFIKASQMTLENLQQLHLIEEAQDYPILNSLSKYPDGVNFNALGSRVINVSDPKDPQDVVTKAYMESVQNGFVTANTILVQEATKQASAAKSSQEAAKTSETNAHTSETNSELSHQNAKKWAEATESPDGEADTDSTTGKTQSAKEWALYSKTKAQESATSATNAKTSETNAKASETNAKTSETKAAVSEANAKTSETNAKSSETKSKDSENAARVSEQNAAESARVATENAMDFNMLKRNKAYSIGDIAYSSYIPSWARLECVKAGTTGAIVPPALGVTHIAGHYITDGTAIFILDDVRDGNRVGDIVLKPTLNAGYIKANGATLKASEYPRLLKFVQDNNLCVSDAGWETNSSTKYVYNQSADTLKVPSIVNRVLQGADTLSTIEAGLPNIKGDFNAIQTDLGQDSGWVDGKLFKKGWTNIYTTGNGAETHAGGQIIFNASGYNAIYGSSDTVQPPACCLIAQLKY